MIIGNVIKNRKSVYLFLSFFLLTALVLMLPSLLSAQDPSGANTGTINDVTAATAGKPTADEVAAQAGHNKISINIVWTLIAGFLVMFMQAGFALVETGFTQKKNVAHTMAMNFLIYVLGLIGFWICGFAFMFGGALNVGALGGSAGVVSHEVTVHLFGHDFGLLGTARYFLNRKGYDGGIFFLFLFQMVFMDTTSTILNGAMA